MPTGVRENLRYADKTVSEMQVSNPDTYNKLVRETALEPTEIDAWMQAADMSVPYDAKLCIIPQDDGFLEKEPWDFRNTPGDHYPLLLFYHPLDIYRKQVIKQADVVLAMFLLGPSFSLEEKKRKNSSSTTHSRRAIRRCTSASKRLSQRRPAIVARAIQYGMAALLMDLADIGGNVKDGCHIASMGGTWMMLVYGLAGMSDSDRTLSFWPRRAPEDNAILQFPVTYRGQMLEVTVSPAEVQYTLREGEALVIRHETEEIRLTPEHPTAIRSVSGW